MKKLRTNILIFLIAVFTLCVSGSISFAWWSTSSGSLSPEVKGGLVEEYFHCGTGIKEDPFVITRPVHYMHMVEFFQRITNLSVGVDESGNSVKAKFGNEYLYFQIGCSESKLYDKSYVDTGEVTNFYVFNYDDNGKVIYDTAEDGTKTAQKTTELNMEYYSGTRALMPLGTSQIPFLGALNGNGLTVKNLHIVAKSDVYVDGVATSRQTCDVGVFGYIGKGTDANGDGEIKDTGDYVEQTSVQNLYFSNVTLDLTNIELNSTSGVNVSETAGTNEHSSDNHNGARVGYLAGHVFTTNVIDKVYLDNCVIAGGKEAKNDWGLFGLVTDTSTGLSVGTLGEYIKTKGESQQFGGTIDMASLYTRVANAYDNKTNQYKNDLTTEYTPTGTDDSYHYYYDTSTYVAGTDDVNKEVDGSYYVRKVDDQNNTNIYYLTGTARKTSSSSDSSASFLNGTVDQSFDIQFTRANNSKVWYLRRNGNYLYTATTTNKSIWYLAENYNDSGSIDYYYLYTIIDSVIYYASCASQSVVTTPTDTCKLTLSNVTTSNSFTTTIQSNSTYLYFSGFSSSTSSSSSTTFTFTPLGSLNMENDYDYVQSDNTTRSTQTYFPISKIASKNTGYFASGNIEGIRVAYHTYSNNKTIYTVDGEGTKTASNLDSFTNDAGYTNVINNCSVTTSGASYGLHFMEASVNTKNLYRIPTAYINGTTYTNYQLTANSVDFYVSEGGKIRFLAGTSYDGNTGFFALYHISRSGGDITAVNEIYKIYSSTQDSIYHYVYQGQTDSYAGNSNYKLEFNCDWITTPESLNIDSLYYFAIPVNAGEYALGSCTKSGFKGAYLYYLDIATSGGGGEVRTNTVHETFKNVDYRSDKDDITANYCMLQLEFSAPSVSSSEEFSVKVDYTGRQNNDSSTDFTDEEDSSIVYTGVYTIYVTLKAGETLSVTACLFDDGVADTTHMYRIKYRTSTSADWVNYTESDKKYFDGSATHTIQT